MAYNNLISFLEGVVAIDQWNLEIYQREENKSWLRFGLGLGLKYIDLTVARN